MWKEQFLSSKQTAEGLKLGTRDGFLKELKKAFEEVDAPGNALWKIKTMKQGSKTAEDHVNEFKLFAKSAGLDISQGKDIAARDYFSETLNRPLRRKILEDQNPPTTLEEWYSKAIKYDTQYRRNQNIFGRDRGSRNEGRPKARGWTFHQTSNRDPNAMDIDALTVEERAELMRKGACFFCRNIGHRATDCPKKRNRNQGSSSPPKTNWKQKTPKELATHIRSLLDEAGTEMEAEVRKIAEEEGF